MNRFRKSPKAERGAIPFLSRSIARVGIALLVALPAVAADLELRYSALERLISAQVFTEDGRKWVKGSAKTPCQFAYLERPRIAGDGDRLKIVAKFTGRSAIGLLGGCVGVGDAFEFTMTAMPVPVNGAISLTDVKVATERDSFYIRRVRQALQQNFGKDFKIQVKDQARHLLEQQQTGDTFQRELSAFNLNGVRVRADALVLEVEFKLVVK
jgi:hypothetical protein